MLQNHVIVCGLGRVGRRVLDYLQAAGVAVVAIDTSITAAEESAAGHLRFLRGDFRKGELLEQAGLDDARGVLILTSDDLVNLSTLMTVIHERRDLRVVVRMFNPSLVNQLGGIAKNVFALSTSALTSPMFALIAHTGGALAAFNLDDRAGSENADGPGELTDFEQTDDNDMLITEWALPARHQLVGMNVSDVKTIATVQLVARRPRDGEQRFFADLRGDEVLAGGDRLIVCGKADVVQQLTGVGEGDVLGRFGWSATSRRFGRVAAKVFAEVDLPVKICTGILLTVIFVSVATFRFGMERDTFVDAFYRTISLMATGADMHGQDVAAGSWQKAFISGLRLVGAVLTAAFTAILTNYLVRAHLRGALEVRRIPEGGHVIVVGLGNVGFRVGQELLRLGDAVVAIERNRDNPFIATGRRLGMAVIVGDALVAEVLKQAHTGVAKAIFVGTDNELTNLEIALLVRERFPDKRILVRLIDPQLAVLLREAANIHLALSIPELAAPAILAAFIGDRIRTVLLAQGQLLAVMDVTVNTGDALADRAVDEWAKRYRLLPLALTVGTTKSDRDFAAASMPVGATLTALLTFRDIHILLQRGAHATQLAS